MPGFCLPKGITPILPIFREAILNGLPEAKEQAAQGLGEVIKLTSASALQPSVVHITGPLIRILGDRFNWSVKAAVLETLAILLGKVIPYIYYLYNINPFVTTSDYNYSADATEILRTTIVVLHKMLLRYYGQL